MLSRYIFPFVVPTTTERRWVFSGFSLVITTSYLWGVVHQDPSIQMSRNAIRGSGRRRLMSDSGRKSGPTILVKQRGQKDCS